MGYIDKAHPALKEYAEENKEFLQAYENDVDVRRFSDLLIKAPKDQIRKCIDYLEELESEV